MSLGSDDPVDALAFSPDGGAFAAGNATGSIGVWALGAGNEVVRLPHPDEVEKISFSPDGRFVATTGGDHRIRLWTTGDWRQIAEIKRFNPDRLVFSADSRFLAVDSQEGGIEVTALGSELRPVKLSAGRREGRVALTSRYLFLERRGKFAVWETAGGATVTEGLGLDEPIERWVISANGNVLATAYRDEASVQIWSVPETRQVRKIALEMRAHDLALTNTGDRLAVLQGRRPDGASRYDPFEWRIEVWNTTDGAREASFPVGDEMPAYFLFDPDGRGLLLLTGSSKGRQSLQAIDPSGRNETVSLSDVTEIRRIRLAPDGEHLAAVSDDRARVWNLATGRIVVEPLTSDAIGDVAFSPDGRYLATAGKDKTATLWYWQAEDLVAQACSRLTRNLSASEWQDFLGIMPYRRTCPGLPNTGAAVDAAG